jgi:hypothetical protein
VTGRTIWHVINNTDERSVEVSFYLGDEPDGTGRRSPYRSFKLAS